MEVSKLHMISNNNHKFTSALIINTSIFVLLVLYEPKHILPSHPFLVIHSNNLRFVVLLLIINC